MLRPKSPPKLSICQNPECGNEFQVKPATKGLYCSRSCGRVGTSAQQNIRQNNIQTYFKNPKLCLCCNDIISYDKQHINKFCSNSCAAKVNNSKSPKRAKQTSWSKVCVICSCKFTTTKRYIKRCSSVECLKQRKHTTNKPEIVGPLTTVYLNKCKHSGKIFYSQHYRKYHFDYAFMYSRDGRQPFEFKFNIFNYPDLFDLDLLKEIGFFSNGKGNSSKNLDGLVRDHKVSVHEAIKNGYDPYYISHVMNCNLITLRENSAKREKSSISYKELVQLVDNYDMGIL